MPLDPEIVIKALRAHEWAYKENLKRIFCPSCGREHRTTVLENSISGVSLPHRIGCPYAALIAEATK